MYLCSWFSPVAARTVRGRATVDVPGRREPARTCGKAAADSRTGAGVVGSDTHADAYGLAATRVDSPGDFPEGPGGNRSCEDATARSGAHIRNRRFRLPLRVLHVTTAVAFSAVNRALNGKIADGT